MFINDQGSVNAINFIIVCDRCVIAAVGSKLFNT